MENAKILVVEDDSEVANIIKNILQNTGFKVPVVVSNGQAAISAAKVFKPDLILMDIILEGDMDGVKAAEKIKELHDVPIIYLTANNNDDILKIASETDPLAFIIKPFKSKDLIANVKNALFKKEYKLLHSGNDKSNKTKKNINNILNSPTNYIYTIEIKENAPFVIKHSYSCIYITGYSPEEFDSDPSLYYQIIFKDDKQMFMENMGKILSKDLIYPFEYRIVRKDGYIRWVHNIPIPRHNANGEVFLYDGLIEDITEKKASDEFIKNILEAVDEGFVVIDRDYRIISANRAFCNQVGMDSETIFGRKCYEVFHKYSVPCYETERLCGVKRVFEFGIPCSTDCHTHGDNKNLLYVETKYYPLKDISGNISSVIVTVLDRTEQKKLEEQLFHAQKMEALGKFASTIAHDLNNYLAAMTTYAQLLKTKIRKNSLLFKYVQQIVLSSDKIVGMTRNLITFGRRQVLNMRPINVFELLKNAENLLSTVIGDKVGLEIVFDSKIKPENLIIKGDSDLLEQALMNLVINARDAMPYGGKISIEVSSYEKNDTFIKGNEFIDNENFIIISVSDTGIGMDEETKSRIFEPFFTTKESGKGTGLGLAIVYRIIKEHKGYIDVQSVVGKGTTFKLYLPFNKSFIEQNFKNC